MAEVVIEDSTHKMAAIASNLVTSFLNISLACAETLGQHVIRDMLIYVKFKDVHNV